MQSILDKIKKCPIYKVPEGWVVEYPEFNKLADDQLHSLWPWDEPEVENDVQDLRVRLTPAEYHGVVTTLKLFTLYEMRVGDEYWSGRVAKKFKRPEIQSMAHLFAAVEFNSHAKFYNKINEVLFLDNEAFYSEWKQSEVLRSRIEFLVDCVKNENDLLSTAAFTFIEGAVLYSSFAFLKHFQSPECGKDLMKNTCGGVSLSVADENTHAVGGAILYNNIHRECNLDQEEKSWLEEKVVKMAKEVYDHESEIIDIIFEKGEIGGISKQQMKDFVKHRINLCLENLQIQPVYSDYGNDIAKWFYRDINSVAFHDFFSANGSEYNINWKENRFGAVWADKE